MPTFSESIVEDAALAWLDELGYAVLHGPDIGIGAPGAERSDPNYRDVILEVRLRLALAQLNPDLPPEALEDAYRKFTRVDAPSLIARNRAVHRMLVNGITVEYARADGSIADAQARVIDFDKPDNNDWLAVNQFTVAEGQHTRRPDVVLFINGLPLAVLELKNAADENATIWSAFHQLETYQAQIPLLFSTNASLIVSDGAQARVGTLGAGREWFKPWRTNRLARLFKVSTLVILRRIHDAGGLTKEEFWREYDKELKRVLAISKGSGGNFYLTQAARVSKRFARALVISTLEGQTLHRDAFRMLGFTKFDTFQKLGRSLGVMA